jgi:hypothetical protein
VTRQEDEHVAGNSGRWGSRNGRRNQEEKFLVKPRSRKGCCHANAMLCLVKPNFSHPLTKPLPPCGPSVSPAPRVSEDAGQPGVELSWRRDHGRMRGPHPSLLTPPRRSGSGSRSRREEAPSRRVARCSAHSGRLLQSSPSRHSIDHLAVLRRGSPPEPPPPPWAHPGQHPTDLPSLAPSPTPPSPLPRQLPRSRLQSSTSRGAPELPATLSIPIRSQDSCLAFGGICWCLLSWGWSLRLAFSLASAWGPGASVA